MDAALKRGNVWCCLHGNSLLRKMERCIFASKTISPKNQSTKNNSANKKMARLLAFIIINLLINRLEETDELFPKLILINCLHNYWSIFSVYVPWIWCYHQITVTTEWPSTEQKAMRTERTCVCCSAPFTLQVRFKLKLDAFSEGLHRNVWLLVMWLWLHTALKLFLKIFFWGGLGLAQHFHSL